MSVFLVKKAALVGKCLTLLLVAPLHLFLQNAVAFIIYRVYAATLPAHVSDGEKLDLLAEFSSHNVYLIMAVSAVLSIALYTLIFRRIIPRNPPEPRQKRLLLLLIPFGVCVNIVLMALLVDTGFYRLFPDWGSTSASSLLQGEAGVFTVLVSLLALGVLAPIAEEIAFRGIVYKKLSGLIGTPAAIIVSALLFGAVHTNLFQGFYTALFGALLAWVYHKTGTLKAPMVMHCAFNSFSVALQYITIGSGLYAVLLAVSVVYVAVLLRLLVKYRI